MDEEGYERFKQRGCNVWYADAEELETKIKNLIVAERTTEDFVEEVRALVQQRDVFRTSAHEAVLRAEQDVSAAKAEYATLARMAAKVAAKIGARVPGADGGEDAADALAEQLVAAKQRERVAEAELAKASSPAARGRACAHPYPRSPRAPRTVTR